MIVKTSLAALVATLGCGLAPLFAQEENQPKPETAQPKAEAQAPQQDVGALIRGLGDPSYKVRVESEKGLRAAGKSALPQLQKAAEDSKDAEVQWRARRLVRQIERGDEGGLRQRADRPQRFDQDDGGRGSGMPDMQGRFDDLFRQLEREFGIDIPRHRFFNDDFFQDLRGQMEAMRQQGGSGSSRGMSMQIGADGAVKVEVKTKNEQGQEETKTYEAPDLQTFQQKYPGVLEQQGFGGVRLFTGNGMLRGLRLHGGNLQAWPQWQQQPPVAQNDDDDQQPTLQDETPPPADKRLGVLVKQEIPQGVRDYLGLEPGKGLMVDEVQEATLAAQIGVQPGDIVLKIGGHDIGSATDVQQALAGIKAGDKVDVELLRKGRPLTLSGKKPAAEETENKPEPAQPLKLRKSK